MLSTKKWLDYNEFKEKMEKVAANPPWLTAKQTHHNRWNPYTFEGGSTAAVAGSDFVIAVSDTRMSQFDVNILTRNAEKVHILNDNIILNTSGFYGDILQLKRVLSAHIHKFRFDYRQDMSVDLCSELLSRNLYYKRFFPFITGSVLCGIDECGKGAVYSYDPIGCLERTNTSCSGSAEPILQPFLDNQIDLENISPDVEKPVLTLERAESILKDAFCFAAEREISTGDSLCVVVAQAEKPIRKYIVPLRED